MFTLVINKKAFNILGSLYMIILGLQLSTLFGEAHVCRDVDIIIKNPDILNQVRIITY